MDGWRMAGSAMADDLQDMTMPSPTRSLPLRTTADCVCCIINDRLFDTETADEWKSVYEHRYSFKSKIVLELVCWLYNLQYTNRILATATINQTAKFLNLNKANVLVMLHSMSFSNVQVYEKA